MEGGDLMRSKPMIRIVTWEDPNWDEEIIRIERRAEELESGVEDVVASIIRRVRDGGDSALCELSKEIDGIEISPQEIEVSWEEREEARQRVDPKVVEALEKEAEMVARFHRMQQKASSWFEIDEDGVLLGQKVSPIGSVGIYAPAGTAPYPSSVIMAAIPARIAGVKRIIMCCPGRRRDWLDLMLVAADISGVDSVFRVGGAQAIAAMAFGTETIPKVDKIVGPGNVYVVTAKRMVYGVVDIEMPPGPSEILVIADESADPSLVASDILSQAEHDPDSLPLLITTSIPFAEKVIEEINVQMESLPRKGIVEKALVDRGAILIVDKMERAVDIANRIAPEHIEIMVENPMEILGRIENAGAVFIGNMSPEPIGDYMAGPSHVLPTGGRARFSSPLNVDDFLKRTNIIWYSAKGLERDIDFGIRIARAEGLEAHARSLEKRLDPK